MKIHYKVVKITPRAVALSDDKRRAAIANLKIREFIPRRERKPSSPPPDPIPS